MPEIEIGDYSLFLHWRPFMCWATALVVTAMYMCIVAKNTMPMLLASIALMVLVVKFTSLGPSRAALRRAIN